MQFLLFFYIYHSEDWIVYPSFSYVRNFTKDARYVYIVTPSCIFQYDENNNRIKDRFTKCDGIPDSIYIAVFDIEKGCFWICDYQGDVFEYNPVARIAIQKLRLTFLPRRISIGRGSVGFENENHIFWYDKYSMERKSFGESLYSHGLIEEDSLHQLTFLTPFYIMDEKFIKHHYKNVFFGENYVYVHANKYGVVLFDRLSRIKNKELRFPNPSIIIGRGEINHIPIFWWDEGYVVLSRELEFHPWEDLEDNQRYLIMKNLYKNLKKIFIEDTLLLLISSQDIQLNGELFFRKSLCDIKDAIYVENKIILGTEKGAYIININKGKAEKIIDERGVVRGEVLKILFKKDTLFFLTRDWVVKFHHKKWYYTPLPYIITREAFDFDGDFFALIENYGIFLYNFKQKVKKTLGFSSIPLKKPRTVYLKDKMLWIAGEDGIAGISISKIF